MSNSEKIKKIVLSIGGSILVPGESDVEYINRLSSILSEESLDNKLYIVVGGGRLARHYIGMASQLGAPIFQQDLIGIGATRMNSWLLISALASRMGDGVYPRPALSIEEAVVASRCHQLVVMGGTHPGHTTDGVSSMLAESVGAELFINATSVDGVYSADPRKVPDATRYERMSHAQLVELILKSEVKAGVNIVIDNLAARVLERSNIRSVVLNGRDLETLQRAIQGRLDEITATLIG